MAKRRFRNKVTVSPSDVQDGDAFAVKVVAVAGHDNDWAAYEGPSHWTDNEVAESGDKLLKEQAAPLFHVFRVSERHYRR